MARRLPPLNSLRAFEAASRHASFTRAAQELFVTQGAISRHVATLEDWLKVQLFSRNPRGIDADPEGRHVLPRSCAARSTSSNTERASCSRSPTRRRCG